MVKQVANKKNNLEATLQSSFFEWLAFAYPDLRKISYAIPNGGSRNAIEGKNLKKQGVTKGVPDVFISFPSSGYHGLYIEFKIGKNKLTPEQKLFKDLVVSHGYYFSVCYNIDTAIQTLEEYIYARH